VTVSDHKAAGAIAAQRQSRHEMYRKQGWWTSDTLDTVFEAKARSIPDVLALVDPSNCAELIAREPLRLTYREVANAAQHLASQFKGKGISSGDIVLVQLPNTTELVITYLALSMIDAIISPVPMQYRQHELSGILQELQAVAIIGCHSFRSENMLPSLASSRIAEEQVLSFNPAADAATRLTLDFNEVTAPVQSKSQPESIFTICWTSGTTGTPKGVPRTHEHWFAQATFMDEAIVLQQGDAILNPFPLTNMAALASFLLQWPRTGTTLVLHHPFDLKIFLDQLMNEKIAYTAAPPAVLNMLLQNEELRDQLDLTHMRYIASGSAPLDPWMVRGFSEHFDIDVVNFFGSNEGIAMVSGPEEVPDPEQRATLFPRHGQPDFTWRGRFAERFETRIVDFNNADTEIMEPGVPGELLIRGPNVFDGYHNSRDVDVFDTEGFFRTGDLFEIAGEEELARYYRFCGRRKELIIRGGINISPEELDGLLSAHPKIVEAATCGYADPIMGEKVCLFAVTQPDVELALAEVTSFLKDQGVAKFKWPERLEIIDSLPRNPLNKVQRHLLAQRLQ